MPGQQAGSEAVGTWFALTVQAHMQLLQECLPRTASASAVTHMRKLQIVTLLLCCSSTRLVMRLPKSMETMVVFSTAGWGLISTEWLT